MGNRHLREESLRSGGYFLCRLVNKLLFDGMILDSLLNSLSRHIFNVSVLEDLRDVLSLVLYGIVIGHLFLLGYVFDTGNGLIFDHSLLVGNVLDSRFTFHDFSWGRGNLLRRYMYHWLLKRGIKLCACSHSYRLTYNLWLYQWLLNVLDRVSTIHVCVWLGLQSLGRLLLLLLLLVLIRHLTLFLAYFILKKISFIILYLLYQTHIFIFPF